MIGLASVGKLETVGETSGVRLGPGALSSQTSNARKASEMIFRWRQSKQCTSREKIIVVKIS